MTRLWQETVQLLGSFGPAAAQALPRLRELAEADELPDDIVMDRTGRVEADFHAAVRTAIDQITVTDEP